MQKTCNKWSILIWAIFLSLIISVTFISISTKINKNLKNYSSFSNIINEQNEIKNIINSWSLNSTFTSQYLDSWSKIIFSSKTIISKWIKQNDTIWAKINENSLLTIQVSKGWPIKYINWTNSWIIIASNNINVFPWNLEITNLWWYSKILIESDSDKNILSNETFYKTLKQVWNKDIIKSKWIIKNF